LFAVDYALRDPPRQQSVALAYQGGQQPIVHLEADLHKSISWSDANKRRWAFSLSNAGARYARFCSSVDDLGEINWQAVAATDFRQPDIKESKQAEFLIHEIFPWALVDRIGVFSREIAQRVGTAMVGATHRPVVAIHRSWYY
jgi:ssDNA thymidine ADP-ribosyltransferase, DarT